MDDLPADPIFCTRDPEKVASAFKTRLLGMAEKVMVQRAYSRWPVNDEARKLGGISEEYAEQARVDLLTRLVQVKDSHEANTIMRRRVAASVD